MTQKDVRLQIKHLKNRSNEISVRISEANGTGVKNANLRNRSFSSGYVKERLGRCSFAFVKSESHTPLCSTIFQDPKKNQFSAAAGELCF